LSGERKYSLFGNEPSAGSHSKYYRKSLPVIFPSLLPASKMNLKRKIRSCSREEKREGEDQGRVDDDD
jgi:hypothetical protein